MDSISFTIYGRLDGLNTLINANRQGSYIGNAVKQKNQKLVKEAIKDLAPISGDFFPCHVLITWYEQNKRRDHDNIASGKKYIFDALQEEGVIPNDSPKYIGNLVDRFEYDKDNPRIEVRLVRANV